MALGLEIGACQLRSHVALVVNYLEPYVTAQKHYVCMCMYTHMHTHPDFIFIF